MSEFTDRTNELVRSPGQPISSISSFGENEYGDIFVADLLDGEVFEIIPANPGAIRGTVTDNLGTPVSGAIIKVMRTEFADTTDTSGQYQLGGLGDGTFDLAISQSGFRDTVISGVVLGVGDTIVENISYLTGLVQSPLPISFRLYQNYPNPFNAKTNIEYDIDRSCHVSIIIFDIRGNRTATLIDSIQPPGRHVVSWDTNDATSGIYFYKIVAGSFSATKKMIVLK